MKLSAFKFDLPANQIALYPAETRDEARLMVVHKATGKIEHKLVKDILDYFEVEDTLVINDTKVFPANLYGSKEKTDAQVEVLLLRALNEQVHLWDTMVDPARKIRVGNRLYFGNGELVAEVVDNTTSRGRTLKFLFDGTQEEFYHIAEQLGTIPLPEQLKRKAEDVDRIHYQTVYAKHIGSVVAPTAGLHFTHYLLKRLELKGINVAPITLHIGLGTLKAIDMEDLTKYRACAEQFLISEETAQVINQSLDNKRQVCAVGTSSLRTVESSVSVAGRLKPGAQWTNKFIFPPYRCKICTSIITGFHLPKSTPFINVASFGGYALIMEAYQVAIKEKYRFFVYGDAMLII